MFDFKNIFKNKDGIVMTEALMAVALMASAVIITGAIIESTVSTTKQSRDYAIAQNLANEAISAVENIINSNSIIYPNDDDCWLNYTTNGECESVIVGYNYVPILSDGRWFLKSLTQNDLNLRISASSNENFRVITEELKSVNTEGQGFIFPMYSHNSDGNKSSFYRSIKVLNFDSSSMNFVVTVQWMDRSIVRNYSSIYTVFRN